MRLYLVVASSCLVSAGATAPLHNSKEGDEALRSSAIESFHGDASSAAARFKEDGPTQRKTFVERKKNRRDLSEMISKKLKGALLSELVGADTSKNKGGGVKAKVARFLFNQKKNKVLSKMKTIKSKDNNENTSSSQQRRTNPLSHHFPWMKKPSLSLVKTSEEEVAEVSFDHDDDPYYYYRPPTLFDVLDQISSTMTSINQTEYTEVVEGLTSLIGEATNITIPSPEDFCADFNVTTTEDECVAAVSSVVTLVEGAIQAPWLIRDIVGYVKAWVDEVVSWETLEGIAGGILSMYGADGTIDGGLGAIRSLMSDLYVLIETIDPYYYYSEIDDIGGFLFDLYPLHVATKLLAYNDNMLEYFGDILYDNIYYSLVEGVEYTLGEGYIDMPEGPEFHADVCEAFGLVPASITAVVSCDYFGDIGQEDIETENVDFCVAPDQDMEDYSAELFSLESTFDKTKLDEMNFGWVFWDLQYQNWKFDNYNFLALDSMTCSIKGRLTREVVCNEKPLNTFLYKDGMERTCKWLRNRKHTEKICENFETARYACPSTCCMCEEDPMELFFRRYVEEDGVQVPELKTCKWLSSRTPENLKKFCHNKNFAPGDLKVASGACPVTCGLCEGRDECQDGIDDYISYLDGLNYIYHTNYTYTSWWEPYYTVNVQDFGESYSYIYYYNSWTYNYLILGFFYERDGNTFLYGDGSECGEDEQISSKLIVESTKDLALNGTTYLYQTSPCTYELKLLTFCNTTDSFNSTNSTTGTTGTSIWSSRNLFQQALKYFYPQPEDEVLDWQK